MLLNQPNNGLLDTQSCCWSNIQTKTSVCKFSPKSSSKPPLNPPFQEALTAHRSTEPKELPVIERNPLSCSGSWILPLSPFQCHRRSKKALRKTNMEGKESIKRLTSSSIVWWIFIKQQQKEPQRDGDEGTWEMEREVLCESVCVRENKEYDKSAH